MFEILLGTGLRANEMLSINIKSIDFAGCLFKKTVRKGGKIKDAPFPTQIKFYLSDYINVRKPFAYNDMLFIHDNGKTVSYCYLKRLMRSLGVKAHQLRHEAAKRVYESSEKDIVATRDFLAHSSVNTTVRYLERGQNFINQKVNKAYF